MSGPFVFGRIQSLNRSYQQCCVKNTTDTLSKVVILLYRFEGLNRINQQMTFQNFQRSYIDKRFSVRDVIGNLSRYYFKGWGSRRRWLPFFFVLFLTCSCNSYRRLGDLTLVSNRNFDSSIEYVELEREVEVKVRLSKIDPLEQAIDKATEMAQGEHLRNVKIYLKRNGRKIKIRGDVWGIKQ